MARIEPRPAHADKAHRRIPCLQEPHGTAATPQVAPRRALADNARMDITLNGEARALEAACTIAALLEMEGLAQRRVAVEVNGEIIPRGRHGEHPLADGDRVEIVHALGGG